MNDLLKRPAPHFPRNWHTYNLTAHDVTTIARFC
jgi:hypothetical protein